MFEALSDRFDGIFKGLRGKGRLREEDVDEVLREIRVALLEADVNFKVVRGMLDRIRERAVGDRAVGGAEPGAAGHQDRPRGAHRGPRRRDDQDHLRQQAAHRRADGRPPGRRQDHQRRQAGPLVQAAGPQPAARRRRPPATGRRRAAPHPRPPDRRAGVLRAGRSGRHRQGRPRRGTPPGARRAHRRHRRSPRHRRGADGAGPSDLRRHEPRTTRSSSSTR